jgi:tetratricopeptide (TPR) repeat protein
MICLSIVLKEDIMKKIIFLVMVLTVFTFQTGLSAAEEDVFDTKAASALYEKGLNHLNNKKLDEAVTAFEDSLSIAPDARTYYFLGYAYYLKGKSGDDESRKKSIESFEQAYELDPSFTPTKCEHAGKIEPAKPEQEIPKPEQKPLPEANTPTPATAVPVPQ